MKTIYASLATASMVFLLLTGFAQAGDGMIPQTPAELGMEQSWDGVPLGLLLDENGQPFLDEFIIRDGLVYT